MMDHAKGRVVMLELADVLDILGCPFFLIQGTALGAVRDGGFVPTEKDIDFGILQEHLTVVVDRLITELIRRRFDVEVFIQPFTRPRTLVASKGGVKADLVGMAKWNGKRFTASPVRDWLTEPYAIVHEAEMLEQYTKVGMFGRTWDVPHRPKKYLRLEYGDEWKTPADDHISRTRVYDFLTKEGVPHDLLERA